MKLCFCRKFAKRLLKKWSLNLNKRSTIKRLSLIATLLVIVTLSVFYGVLFSRLNHDYKTWVFSFLPASGDGISAKNYSTERISIHFARFSLLQDSCDFEVIWTTLSDSLLGLNQNRKTKRWSPSLEQVHSDTGQLSVLGGQQQPAKPIHSIDGCK